MVHSKFLSVRQNLFYFNGAGKFCLAHRLSQHASDVKCDVKILNFKSDVIFAPPRKIPNDVRKRSLCDVKYQKLKISRILFNNF